MTSGRPQSYWAACGAGMDTCAQVRFVEDNWENPTLGAWGLGWEVWMDGARLCSAQLISALWLPGRPEQLRALPLMQCFEQVVCSADKVHAS